MYGSLGVLIAAFCTYAILVLRWWSLSDRPWGLFALLTLAVALVITEIAKAKNKRIANLMAAPIILYCIALGAGITVLTDYGAERAFGPKVGQEFPAMALAPARGGNAVHVGDFASADENGDGTADSNAKYQLVVVFRGFW